MCHENYSDDNLKGISIAYINCLRIDCLCSSSSEVFVTPLTSSFISQS